MTEKKFEIPPAKLTPEDQEYLKSLAPGQIANITSRMQEDQNDNANHTGKNLSAVETLAQMMREEAEDRSR